MNINKWIKNNTSNLSGKTVAITGSTSGLGLNTVKILAKLNANFIFLNRNIQKSETLKRELLSQNPNINIDIIKVDMSDTSSVINASKSLSSKKIDYLILNAGTYAEKLTTTSSGYNNIFTINFVSPFMLVKYLLPTLQKNHSKVITVGSIAYRFSDINPQDIDFSSYKNVNKIYGNSKRFLMFSLTSLLSPYPEISYSIAHPGISATNITSNYPELLKKIIKLPMRLIFTSPKKACLNTIYAIFNDCDIKQWIGPKTFDIWGKPKIKPLKISDSELNKIAEISKNIGNKLF